MTREEAEAKYRAPLTEANLYADRNCMHRNMGPPELFPCCAGRGYFPDDTGRERYCTCAAGAERKRTDT